MTALEDHPQHVVGDRSQFFVVAEKLDRVSELVQLHPPAPVKAFGSVADPAPWLLQRFEEESTALSASMEDLLASRQ